MFSLAPTLRTQLPQLNKAGLAAARDFIGGKTKLLPFTFFEKTFPKDAQNIVIEQVRHGESLVIVVRVFVRDLIRDAI